MRSEKTAAKTKRPRPPDDLGEEASLEWHRVCDELADAGRLEAADRAVLTLYVETWGVWRTASLHVKTFGPVVPGQNGVVGRSPFYATQRETAAQLRNLLADLGLTPQARGKSAAGDDEDPLTF